MKRHPHRIQFLDRTRTQNASMEFIETDKDLGKRSGTISPLRGDSRLVAEEFRNVVTHQLKMRYDPNIFSTGGRLKTDWIAVYDSRRFRIIDFSRDKERGNNATLQLEEMA